MIEKMISLSRAELELLFVNLQELIEEGQMDIPLNQLARLMCLLGRPTVPSEF